MDIKVLIIEDNVITLDEIEMRLNDLGYTTIETAVNGQEAFNKAETFKPDLILSDINLGQGIDGIATVKQIQHSLNVPVIYITAYDDDTTLKRAQITEPYAYLIKPINEREMSIAISIALYKHNAEKKLQELNQQLQETITVKNIFFSIIAHDLRTVFNGILGFFEIFFKSDHESDHVTDDQNTHILSLIHQSAISAYTLLGNLLTWSRSQTNKIEFRPEHINGTQIVNEVFNLYKETAQKKNITLLNNIDEAIKIFADKNMLDVIIRNLVGNALKFTPRDGSISISVHQASANEIIISVKDTGLGMDEHVLNDLFRLDKKVSTTGIEGEKGTGLGLILCKDFVEKHNGKIWAESEVGVGSTFSFSIKTNNA